MNDVRVNVETREIEIPAPRGSKLLVFQFPHDVDRDVFRRFAEEAKRSTVDYRHEHPGEPVWSSYDVTVRWLEAEAPEVMKASAAIPLTHELLDEFEETRRAMTGTSSDEELTEKLRAPSALPKQKRAMTKLTKGLGPERVRKT